VKDAIETLLGAALRALEGELVPAGAVPATIPLERSRDPAHGEIATNIALLLAKPAKRPPRELAQRIVAALPTDPRIDRVEVAGPGFINFHLAPDAYRDGVRDVLRLGKDYGRSRVGAGTRVMVEFVSANPTGPLHVGHGRGAAYGATVSNLLQALGYDVHREYYVNDAGRQMDILATSVWLRYLENLGERVQFPANGYRGEYVVDIAAELYAKVGDRLARPAAQLIETLPPDEPEGGDKEEYIDALIARTRSLLGEEDYRLVFDEGLNAILEDIREDLAEFGVTYDEWFSERRLREAKFVEHALQRLEAQGHCYRKDGALWLRATDYGDEKDRVVVRDNGSYTYFASDIAYQLNKRERGFDVLLMVLGADHHGYMARLRAGLEAMGESGDSLEVRLIQFVTLYRGGEKVQMSTRSGEFITLRELRAEVGNDAARLFYVARSNEQHLDFDLELAKSQSEDNPVYYLQYAHARVASVFRKLAEHGWTWSTDEGIAAVGALEQPAEFALMRAIARYGDALETAATRRAPQILVQYLRELAGELHACYNQHKILVEEPRLRAARLALAEATRQVIANGLALLGVSAPQTM
jgi:arginyl-tRNA synthetase